MIAYSAGPAAGPSRGKSVICVTGIRKRIIAPPDILAAQTAPVQPLFACWRHMRSDIAVTKSYYLEGCLYAWRDSRRARLTGKRRSVARPGRSGGVNRAGLGNLEDRPIIGLLPRCHGPPEVGEHGLSGPEVFASLVKCLVIWLTLEVEMGKLSSMRSLQEMCQVGLGRKIYLTSTLKSGTLG